MGASQASIMIIFMVQGLVAGILGTVIGVALGLGLAGSITDVSLALEQFVNSNIDGANCISYHICKRRWSPLRLCWFAWPPCYLFPGDPVSSLSCQLHTACGSVAL